MAEKLIGEVSHWFGGISVVGIKLTDKLAVGDRIHILGHTTDHEQEVTSIQIMHQDVKEAKRGDDVGVKIGAQARVGDKVYRVE
jgi:putative protease